MYIFLLRCFLFNFFASALLFEIANCFKQPLDSYNDTKSLEISGTIGMYALTRVMGKRIELMSDIQILLLDWFVHRHFILKGDLGYADRLRSVTRLKCLKNPSPEASTKFFKFMVDYIKYELTFRNAGGSNAARSNATRLLAIHDKSSVRTTGESAARPIVIDDQSSVSTAGGSNAAGLVIRPVPSVGGFDVDGLLDAGSQSHNLS